jgi:hypothetical protein
MEHTNILLYSKFSPASRKMIETFETFKTLEKNFTLVCIDNKKTRERIEKSTKLNIKEVPSILRVYQDTGYVETFEGEKAFQLFNKYIIELKKQTDEEPQSYDQNSDFSSKNVQHVQPVQLLKKKVPTNTPTNTPIQGPKKSHQIANIPQLDNNFSSVSNMSSNVSELMPENQPKQDSIQKQQKLINATSIEDLGSDINRGQTVNTYMHVPTSVEFDIDIENRQRTIKTDRSVKNTDSGGNIVTRAMQMQKEREQDASTPNGPRSMPMS